MFSEPKISLKKNRKRALYTVIISALTLSTIFLVGSVNQTMKQREYQLIHTERLPFICEEDNVRQLT